MSDTPLQSNFTSGKTDSSLTLYRGVGEITTTLAQDLLAAEDELCLVTDATGAVQSGIAICEDEIFFFAERLNHDRVTILTREIEGTTAVDHLAGASITLYPRFFIPQAWQETILGLQNNTSVEAKTIDYITTTGDRNKIFTNEGASAEINFPLPPALAGLSFNFFVHDSRGIKIIADGSNTIRIQSSVSAAGGYIESLQPGDYMTLYAINSSEWVAFSPIQNWTIS